MFQILCLTFLLLITSLLSRFSFWKRRSFPELKFSRVRKSWRKVRFNAVVNELYRLTAHAPFVGVYYFLQPLLLVNDPQLATRIMTALGDSSMERHLNRWFVTQSLIANLHHEELWVILCCILFGQPPHVVKRRKEFQLLSNNSGANPHQTGRVQNFLSDEVFSQPAAFVKIFHQQYNAPESSSEKCVKEFLTFFIKLQVELSHIIEHTMGHLKQAPQLMEKLKSEQNHLLLDLCVKEVIRLHPPKAVARVFVSSTSVGDGDNLLLAEAHHLRLPRDVEIVIPWAKINQNASVYPKPGEFLPEQHQGHEQLEPTFVNEIAKMVIFNRITQICNKNS